MRTSHGLIVTLLVALCPSTHASATSSARKQCLPAGKTPAGEFDDCLDPKTKLTTRDRLRVIANAKAAKGKPGAAKAKAALAKWLFAPWSRSIRAALVKALIAHGVLTRRLVKRIPSPRRLLRTITKQLHTP